MLRTVSRAGRVLDLFSVERPEWGATAVARELDIAKSQAHELLVSLNDIGLLDRVRAGRYRLGWRIVALGSLLFDTSGLRDAAIPAMEPLAGRYGETVQLAVWGHGRPVCVATVQGRQANAVAPWPLGAGPPADRTALGKVLLCGRPAGELQGILERAGADRRPGETPVSAAQLSRELANVRGRGFAHEEEEHERGTCAAAAPVVHRRGAVVAAIGMSAPAHRWRMRRAVYTRALVTAAADISRHVGHRERGDRRRSAYPNGALT